MSRFLCFLGLHRWVRYDADHYQHLWIGHYFCLRCDRRCKVWHDAGERTNHD